MHRKDFFAHPMAVIESEHIGSGTRIWGFTHVMDGSRIGENCNIGEQCFVENNATIGDAVVVKNGVSLWEGVHLEDAVFVGPHASFTNDCTPRAKLFRKPVSTLVCKGASIGANATIRCGVVIGRWAMVGAGSVVTKDVPNFALVFGNPAKVQGWVCKCGKRLVFIEYIAACQCGLAYEMSSSPNLAPTIVCGDLHDANR